MIYACKRVKQRRTCSVTFDDSNEILRLGKGECTVRGMVRMRYIIRDRGF